jgi:hypothetical protein
MGDHRQLPRIGVNISASGALALSQTVFFKNANGFLFGISSSGTGTAYTITAAAGAGGLAISAGSTLASSGQLVFGNGGGINFGVSGSTITAQVASISVWDNMQGPGVVPDASSIYLHRAVLSRGISATRADVVVSLGSNVGSQYTMSLGVYTMSGTVASLASSASVSVSWLATQSTLQTGCLWRSIPVSFLMSSGDYMFAIAITCSTAGIGAISWFGRTAVGFNELNSTGGPVPWMFGDYFWNGASTALPNAISAGTQTQLNPGDDITPNPVIIPYLRLAGTY